MPANAQVDQCVSLEREALVFWSPEADRRRLGARVQIVDVFSLTVATGFTRDPQGRLLLEAQPTMATARSWSLAKAAQLIRNDARPHRWVALQLDRRAWGLFWAGGGIQRCRELLSQRIPPCEASAALVPATPEALLKLVLDLEGVALRGVPAPAAPSNLTPGLGPVSKRLVSPWGHLGGLDARWGTFRGPWAVAVWTSMAWLVILGVTISGFLSVLERQDQKLQLLLDRMHPSPLQR